MQLPAHTKRPCALRRHADTGSWDRHRSRKTGRTGTDDSARTPPCCAVDPGAAGGDCPGRWLRRSRCDCRLRWRYVRRRESNFSAVRRLRRASSSRMVLMSSSSSQFAGRRQIHFKYPGIGSNAERSHPRIERWRVALHPHRHIQKPARVFDSTDHVEIVGKNRCIGQKHMHAAFPRLHAQRRPDQLRRFVGGARAQPEEDRPRERCRTVPCAAPQQTGA